MRTKKLTVEEFHANNKLYGYLVNAEKTMGSRKIADSENLGDRLRKITSIAANNNYNLHEMTSSDPSVYLIGHDFNGKTTSDTAKFIDTLGNDGILADFNVLSEFYDGNATLFYSAVSIITKKMNAVFAKHQIRPEGNDSFELRKKHHDNLRKANYLFRMNKERGLTSGEVNHLNELVSEAMVCFIKREKDHLFPHIKEHLMKGNDVIYLLDYWHILSPGLIGELSKEKTGYVSFAPGI
ncbi:MAG: hypothetical protein KKH52_01150 [Nanoarchaeota archaeon]|nr:hypothetical protein [Nanoarchaeota archaeon]